MIPGDHAPHRFRGLLRSILLSAALTVLLSSISFQFRGATESIPQGDSGYADAGGSEVWACGLVNGAFFFYAESRPALEGEANSGVGFALCRTAFPPFAWKRDVWIGSLTWILAVWLIVPAVVLLLRLTSRKKPRQLSTGPA
jgi:hypothetical protein